MTRVPTPAPKIPVLTTPKDRIEGSGKGVTRKIKMAKNLKKSMTLSNLKRTRTAKLHRKMRMARNITITTTPRNHTITKTAKNLIKTTIEKMAKNPKTIRMRIRNPTGLTTSHKRVNLVGTVNPRMAKNLRTTMARSLRRIRTAKIHRKTRMAKNLTRTTTMERNLSKIKMARNLGKTTIERMAINLEMMKMRIRNSIVLRTSQKKVELVGTVNPRMVRTSTRMVTKKRKTSLFAGIWWIKKTNMELVFYLLAINKVAMVAPITKVITI